MSTKYWQISFYKHRLISFSSFSAPPTKKLRSESGTEDSSTQSHATDDETDMTAGKQEKTMASYSAELIVYDRHKTCLLTEGVYELLLQPTEETNKTNARGSSWESSFRTKVSGIVEVSFTKSVNVPDNVVRLYLTYKSTWNLFTYLLSM